MERLSDLLVTQSSTGAAYVVDLAIGIALGLLVVVVYLIVLRHRNAADQDGDNGEEPGLGET